MNTAPLNPDDIKAVYLTEEDLVVASSILYQAYHDDPLFMEIFKAEDDEYESRLRGAIREELNTFWRARQPMIGIFEGQRLLAVACVLRPDAGFGPGRFWHWRLKMLLTAGLFGTRQMVEKEQKVKDNVPARHYHLLSFIGVHPDHQHRGLGHLLMGAVDTLVREDPQSQGVAVLVTLPKCLSFFEHGQYHHLSELQVGRIRGQLMFRDRSEKS
ncbi:GNAT family N-acetyltransferase [Lacimicrobium alkaliphilum]|uniref:GCN5 family acetyltransferase n=1 Tax=Lacimicrobium alkaliphilum TaxID=1526571 RepID=A0A0U2ZF47_9ALTE|nr:GNAT family N-acetyltransferase [Lacimicrobium alkaliphilum]ALS97751.1 GCN5 family acetyltransferase [Lacimicrobium alkaliphilum]